MSTSTTSPRNDTAGNGTFGERIAQLGELCREEDITLGKLAGHLGSHSAPLLVFLLTVPFCQPVPMLGFSTPVGLLLAFLGFQMLRGKTLKIPPRCQSWTLRKKIFSAFINGSGRLLKWLEKRLHPRWEKVVGSRLALRLCAANLIVNALLLALPLPIPFSNFFPAVPIAISMAALLERDGKMLFIAGIAAAANAVFWLICLALVLFSGWSIA